MNINNITSLSEAQTYLTSVSSNDQILNEIQKIIYSWNYKSEFNLEAIKHDLNSIIAEVILRYFDNQISEDISKAISCVVFNEIYENLIPLIRGNFSKTDLLLYEKCENFCKTNATPVELGSSIYNSLPFTAAIVELSVLDNYKSPLEKLNCLCYTYDLIFADLKLALASIISKYSEKELEIPIINNEEVVPIITLVVIKSKLLYLPSNLFYIQFFGENILQQNDGIRTILNTFETVIHKLIKCEDNYTKPLGDKLSPRLDICQTMEIMADAENLDKYANNGVKFIDEEKKRIAALITTSTTEKNFIPFDLPKIFN